MIELTTLGHEAIRRDGEEILGLSAHRQKFALLVYVALEGRVTRDRLLALFWPEREEERARHSLSQALYALRRELQEDCLRVEGDYIAASESVWLDAKRLESAAAIENWEAMVDLYAGPFLDQFALPGTPDFETWQSSARTRLARLARRAFRAVVKHRQARGDLPGALATAWRWATLQPLGDEAQHKLIELLALTGDRAAALDQYETYRARLESELAVEPLDETVALIERIRSGDPELRPPAGPAPEGAPQAPSLEKAPGATVPQIIEGGRWIALLGRLRRRRVPAWIGKLLGGHLLLILAVAALW